MDRSYICTEKKNIDKPEACVDSAYLSMLKASLFQIITPIYNFYLYCLIFTVFTLTFSFLFLVGVHYVATCSFCFRLFNFGVIVNESLFLERLVTFTYTRNMFTGNRFRYCITHLPKKLGVLFLGSRYLSLSIPWLCIIFSTGR